MRWLFVTAVLFTGIGSATAEDAPTPESSPVDPEAAERLVLASDRAWLHGLSSVRMGAVETTVGTFGPERISSVVWDGAVSLHIDRFAPGTPTERFQDSEPEVLRVVTRDAAGRWMAAQQGSPRTRNIHKWNGWVGNDALSDLTLDYAPFCTMFPILGRTLSDIVAERPIVSASRVGDKLVLHVSATRALAEAYRSGSKLEVMGHLGWRITLLPDYGGRVQSWEMIVAAPKNADGQRVLPAGREAVTLAGVLGYSESTMVAADWIKVSGQWFPCSVTRKYRNEAGSINQESVSRIAYRPLDSIPAEFQMALVPPPHLGPVGIMMNRNTNTREVFDRRPEGERIAGREDLVDQMVRDAPSLGAEADGGSHWAWWILSIVLALGALLLWRRARRRRNSEP